MSLSKSSLPFSFTPETVDNAPVSEVSGSREPSVSSEISSLTTPATTASILPDVSTIDSLSEDGLVDATPSAPATICCPPNGQLYRSEGDCEDSPSEERSCDLSKRLLDDISRYREHKAKFGLTSRGLAKLSKTFQRPHEIKLFCAVCMDAETFEDCHSLIRHLCRHLCDTHKPFHCTAPGCSYVASQLSNANSHLRTHTKEKIPCGQPGCAWTGPDPSALCRHRADRHPDVRTKGQKRAIPKRLASRSSRKRALSESTEEGARAGEGSMPQQAGWGGAYTPVLPSVLLSPTVAVASPAPAPQGLFTFVAVTHTPTGMQSSPYRTRSIKRRRVHPSSDMDVQAAGNPHDFVDDTHTRDIPCSFRTDMWNPSGDEAARRFYLAEQYSAQCSFADRKMHLTPYYEWDTSDGISMPLTLSPVFSWGPTY